MEENNRGDGLISFLAGVAVGAVIFFVARFTSNLHQ